MGTSNHDTVIFLRVLGIFMLVFSWLTVLRPEMKVYWGKGRSTSRAPLSQKSKLAFAIAISGWCLGVFSGNQTLAVSLFLIGFVTACISGSDDQKEHARQTGTTARKPPTPQEMWLALCIMDGALFAITLYAMVRDHFHPPLTNEQKSVHAMGLVLFSLLSVGGVRLYLKRPGKPQESD